MLKTNRGLLMYILLTSVTCGIYSFFWIHGIAKDLNVACQGDGKHTRGLLGYILLTTITCGIYALVWQYGVCERIAQNCYRRNIAAPVDGGKYLLWSLVGSMLCGIGPFVALHKLCVGMNTVCAAYNTGAGTGAAGQTPVVNVVINK